METQKAELEYNLRASEYNVEILKTKNDELQTEIELVKKQNSKHKRLCRMLKDKCELNSKDLQNYKQQAKETKSLGKKAANSVQLDESMLIDLNDSIFKDSPSKTNADSAANSKELENKEKALTELRLKNEEQVLQIKSLEARLSEKDAAITLTTPRASAARNQKRQMSRGRPAATPANSDFAVPSPVKDDREEVIATLKGDNQKLISRLSEYKKAEKTAMGLVKDYAEMRDKYATVLVENKRHKETLAELMTERKRTRRS